MNKPTATANIILAVMVITIIVMLMFPSKAPMPSSRSQHICAAQLDRVATALQQYVRQYGRLPETLDMLEAVGLRRDDLECRKPSPTKWVYTPNGTETLVACQKHFLFDHGKPYRVGRDFRVHSFRKPHK